MTARDIPVYSLGMPDEALSYLDGLEKNQATIQPAIEWLMAQCLTRPFLPGFAEIITRIEYCEPFLDGLTEIGVVVRWISLYCDDTRANRARGYGCPHGVYGWPYESGYFLDTGPCMPSYQADDSLVFGNVGVARDSRMVDHCNAFAAAYIKDCIKRRHELLPCMVLTFTLAVPEHWVRTLYMPRHSG